ncbi:MAG: hypothetical protein DMF61_14165 [Blastocatellia bacterium AA13]|nr:MAG: hypothetical protein DMF61_14165 [Blastocatellia bacterium AA13]
MYCPSCSTQAADGAKFCKTCGLSLTIINQAINGDTGFSDPLRDREYKRARKQISEGIHGISVGAAFLTACGLAYAFLSVQQTFVLIPVLSLALIGLVFVFRNAGKLIDAKVGQKMASRPTQLRGTGALGSAPVTTAFQPQARSSSKSNPPSGASSSSSSPLAPAQPNQSVQRSQTAQPAATQRRSTALAPMNPSRPLPTGRINREQSSPLRRDKKDDDLLAKIRN